MSIPALKAMTELQHYTVNNNKLHLRSQDGSRELWIGKTHAGDGLIIWFVKDGTWKQIETTANWLYDYLLGALDV